ncbi:hypothetical protein PVMG_05636 [Plasmodium vivax Mauritania I]|uniref:Variable surface protein n=1 Tax=Plasmodium vivax Mauritania I TaxID=1035515 RepID=A0A0J9TJN9_PLAVI|nr:hypothetical protein PVMG_05636 [Plasmodium vivax Mauritania I]
MINHYIEYSISNYTLCNNAIQKNILLLEFKYDVKNIYHTYKEIIESWSPSANFQTSEDCFFIKQDYIKKHADTFKNTHCSKAQHYLYAVESRSVSQYLSNGCKYFLYWLYYDVLNKKVDYHKVLKVYEDVLTGYIEGSSNDYFRNYVNIFSEETIEKIIKLTEMYDNFHKLKEEDKQVGGNKCHHAEECVRLYKENIKICEDGNDYDFCYELDNMKESYDEYMKSNECCPNSPKTLESYRLYNPAVVIITPFSILLVISLSLFFLYKVNFILFQIYEYYTNICSFYFKTKLLLN